MSCADDGCSYILGKNGTADYCGAEVKQGSSFCPEHHAVCYVPIDSRAGQKRLAEIESATAGGAKMVFSRRRHHELYMQERFRSDFYLRARTVKRTFQDVDLSATAFGNVKS